MEHAQHNLPSEEKSFKSYLKKYKSVFIIFTVGLLVCAAAFLFTGNREPAGKDKLAQQTLADTFLALEKAVEKDPTELNVINLTGAYISNGLPVKAFPYLKSHLKKFPNSADAYNNLGVANIMLKNYKQGIEACEKAVALNKNFQLAKNNLQWGIDERNKVIAHLATLKKQPNAHDSNWFMQLGLDHFQLGNYRESILIWSEGLDKFPANNVLFHYNIGSAMVFLKDYDGAIKNFEEALKAEPNNQLAKNNIDWAKSEATENTQQ